ncbi:MAG: acyl-CoA dehydrogenase family protein [Pseudohongiellaceae bacterium]
MSLALNDDQLMLRDSARGFCREEAPISVHRRLRDSRDALGYDPRLWLQMVELGWAGMALPEAYGGFDFGYSGLGIVLEETGRTLVDSPLISTVLLSATAINLGGSEALKKALLPEIAAGSMVVAFAADEHALHRPERVTCRAEPVGAGYRITGRKTLVLDGHVADRLVVVARTAGEDDDREGISLFVVEAGSTNVQVNRTWMVDSRNASEVVFDGLEVSADKLLGEAGKGFELLEQILDTGRIGVAAEMLGSIQEVFDRIVQYLQQREQFGVAIGSFQGLQHRAAEMYSEIELCRSLVRAALTELDHGDRYRVAELASMAKAKLAEVYFIVSNEGVQMHGGIGMTDEFDIGFFLKRARVAAQFLGDAVYHRDRYAKLQQF